MDISKVLYLDFLISNTPTGIKATEHRILTLVDLFWFWRDRALHVGKDNSRHLFYTATHPSYASGYSLALLIPYLLPR